jgi:septin 6/8/11
MIIDKLLKVNVMPIIAKADTVSKYELNEFKKRIMKDLTENNVNVYQFPVNDSDLEISNVNAAANALYPLAVIGSSELVKIGSKFTKGRSYEWGTVSVENEAHCDFVKLRDMVLSTNMIDLIERTHTKHYQVYRARRLQEMGFKDGDIQALDEKGEELFAEKKGRNVFEVYNLKRIELDELVQRREFEIKEDFVRKVKNKEMELRESEKEVAFLFVSQAL